MAKRNNVSEAGARVSVLYRVSTSRTLHDNRRLVCDLFSLLPPSQTNLYRAIFHSWEVALLQYHAIPCPFSSIHN